MAEDDKDDPADFIKAIHARLRAETQTRPEAELRCWRQHAQGRKRNDDYARTMMAMATRKWRMKSDRISWIVEKIRLYFIEGDKKRFRDVLDRKCGIPPSHEEEGALNIKVFDVGSCYNPFKDAFKDEDGVNVVAVDLAPAVESVLEGDFLNVRLEDGKMKTENGRLETLPLDAFDAVVFCLVLEYLPSPTLRLEAVSRAVAVLKAFGLLLIATPDSTKHEAKNAKIMRMWKLGASKLGLKRTRGNSASPQTSPSKNYS